MAGGQTHRRRSGTTRRNIRSRKKSAPVRRRARSSHRNNRRVGGNSSLCRDTDCLVRSLYKNLRVLAPYTLNFSNENCRRVRFRGCDLYHELGEAIVTYRHLQIGRFDRPLSLDAIRAALGNVSETGTLSDKEHEALDNIDYLLGVRIKSGKDRNTWACGSLGYDRDSIVYRCRSRGRYYGEEGCGPASVYQRPVRCSSPAGRRGFRTGSRNVRD